MVSLVLIAIWGAFDFFLLAAGGVMIAFSILWKAPDVFRNLIFTEMDLNGASPCPSTADLLTASLGPLAPWLPIPLALKNTTICTSPGIAVHSRHGPRNPLRCHVHHLRGRNRPTQPRNHWSRHPQLAPPLRHDLHPHLRVCSLVPYPPRTGQL